MTLAQKIHFVHVIVVNVHTLLGRIPHVLLFFFRITWPLSSLELLWQLKFKDKMLQSYTFAQKQRPTPDKTSNICSPSSCHAPVSHFHSSPCGLLPFLLLLLSSLCWLPVEGAWFRVGVVGPWGCDPLFAKALPHVAAQLAVNRINRDPALAYARTFEVTVLQVNWSAPVVVFF